jgi:hypothetical protein
MGAVELEAQIEQILPTRISRGLSASRTLSMAFPLRGRSEPAASWDLA